MKSSKLSEKAQCTLLVAAFFALLVAAVPAEAAQLRGRLDRVDAWGRRYPAQGVYVTVYSQRLGRSIAVATDAYGMYYLNVPAGPYWLEVWVSNPARVYQIHVVEPNTDIPPIVV